MNEFSLFRHRCLDPQLIIRDLPSARTRLVGRSLPRAVMANSRLRNHAATTPVPKYSLRKSARLGLRTYVRTCGSRTVAPCGDCFSFVTAVSIREMASSRVNFQKITLPTTVIDLIFSSIFSYSVRQGARSFRRRVYFRFFFFSFTRGNRIIIDSF